MESELSDHRGSQAVLRDALRDEIVEIRAALSRSDQKAGTLLGIVGVALALTLTVLTTAKARNLHGIAILAFGGGCLGAAALGAAALMLIIAVRPVTGMSEAWPRFATKTAEEIVHALEGEAVVAANIRMATMIRHLTGRALRKLRYVQISTDLMIAALLTLVFSAVLFATAT